MKKKASLLISGITTVAMLAVAVGSFAAWDKLDASSEGLTATSGNPAVLKVDTDITGAETSKKLVPNGAFKGTNDDTTLIVGKITPIIADKYAEASKTNVTDKSDKIDIKYKAVANNDGSETDNGKYTVELYNGDTKVDTDALVANTEYTVKVSYKSENSAAAWDTTTDVDAVAGSSISVKINVTGTEKASTPS